jgi:hypothetical protein
MDVASVHPETSSSQEKLIKITEQETATNLGLGGRIPFVFKCFFSPLQKNTGQRLKVGKDSFLCNTSRFNQYIFTG